MIGPTNSVRGPFSSDKIYCEDCSIGLSNVPDGSIDLIVTDPPYYRVMVEDYKGEKYEWDKQWDTLEEYLKWFDRILTEFERVLKSNGSLYIYANNETAAHIQVMAEKRFHLINVITWVKTNGMNSKYWRNIRGFAAVTERVLFMEKLGISGLPKTGWQEIHSTTDCFRSVKNYLISERDRLMSDKGMMDMTTFRRYFTEITGTDRMEYHYFGDYQWSMPTPEIYGKMQSTGYWCRDYEDLRHEYEDLRHEYEDLRHEYEDLRRPFHPERNYTDVWTSLITTSMEGKLVHPTQKPVSHIMRMIMTSSNPGDVILDPFIGSGTTAVACIESNRHYIGFEISEKYCEIAAKRISEANHKMTAPFSHARQTSLASFQEDLQ